MKKENLQYSHEDMAVNRDLEMARYIWSILKTQLTIIMSWMSKYYQIRSRKISFWKRYPSNKPLIHCLNGKLWLFAYGTIMD